MDTICLPSIWNDYDIAMYNRFGKPYIPSNTITPLLVLTWETSG